MVRFIVGKKSSKKKSRVKTEDEILAEVMKQTEIEYEEMQKKRQAENENTPKTDTSYDEKMEKIISESNDQER